MSKSKAKGTAAETAVVKYLNSQGYELAHRNPPQGSKDKGDIGGIVGLVIEVKNHKALALAEWVDEAAVEASNAEAEYDTPHVGVVWHHRPGKGNPSEWYVTMAGSEFLELSLPYTWEAMRKAGIVE